MHRTMKDERRKATVRRWSFVLRPLLSGGQETWSHIALEIGDGRLERVVDRKELVKPNDVEDTRHLLAQSG
jgi:hypothetical protein